MKIAAERDKDTLDIARLLRRLNITNAANAVDPAYDKYDEHSIPLAAGRGNYLIVVDDALDAATTLQSEPTNETPDRRAIDIPSGTIYSKGLGLKGSSTLVPSAHQPTPIPATRRRTDRPSSAFEARGYK